MINEKNYGFQKENIKVDSSHYILGASPVPQDILQPDGNWQPFIPTFEPQSVNFETYGCTVWGTIHAIQVLIKKIYGTDSDYAQRYDYDLAGIRPPGGDPHVVAEVIRKNGVIDQALLPMTATYADFIQPDPMTPDLIAKGQAWLADKNFLHEWVWTNTPDKAARVALLQQALQYSPVAMSVTAWMQDANGLYIDNGQPNCHWVCCIALEEQPNGEFCPIIIDSYELILSGVPTQYIKKLHPDHHSDFAKRYAVTPKLTTQQIGIWQRIVAAISKILQLDLMQLSTASKPIVNNIVKQVPVTADVTVNTIKISTPAPITPPPVVATPTIFPPKILAWYKGIRQWEGADPASNNGGNLKYTTLTASWGAIQGRPAKDGGFLCSFPTREMGDDACCKFLVMICKNQALDFHSPEARTFEGCTKIYAGNPPQSYIQGIADAIGCALTTDVSTFLTS